MDDQKSLDNVRLEDGILKLDTVIKINLTELQTNILRYKALGYTAKDIAEELDYGSRYIESEWEILKQTLYFRSRRELVEWLVEIGLIEIKF